MKRILPILTILILMPAPQGTAGEIVQRQGIGTLEVHFEGPVPRLALADVFSVTLQIEGKKGLRVKAPDPWPTNVPWLLVEMSAPRREALPGGKERWRIDYKLAPREPGEKISLAFPDVRVRESDDPAEEHILVWQPIDFAVTTEIGNVKEPRLRDITSIESIPDPDSPTSIWHWLVTAGIAASLAAAVVFWHFLARGRAARTPLALALHELQRLLSLDLPRKGRSERFITLLTLLLRQFLERQFAIPARRQTTPEFVESLRQNKHFNDSERQFLTSFLASCDTIKFANLEVASQECDRLADSTRQFLLNHRPSIRA